MQTHWNTPIHHEGYLYASSGRHDANAELRCIELASGKVMWQVPDLSRSTLLYADGHLICLTEHGMLLLLKANPNKYEEVARSIPADRAGAFGPASCSSIRPGLRRCSRTACSTCGARAGWFAWN